MSKKKLSRNSKRDETRTALPRTLELTRYHAVVVPIRSTTLSLLLNRRVSREMLDQITLDLLDWLKANPDGLPPLPIAPLHDPKEPTP